MTRDKHIVYTYTCVPSTLAINKKMKQRIYRSFVITELRLVFSHKGFTNTRSTYLCFYLYLFLSHYRR